MSAPLTSSAAKALYRSMLVINRLPRWRTEGRRFPKDIIGATIQGFGSAPIDLDIEGGGLVIDYVPQGQTEPNRLVLGFNELSMWIEYSGKRR